MLARNIKSQIQYTLLAGATIQIGRNLECHSHAPAAPKDGGLYIRSSMEEETDKEEEEGEEEDDEGEDDTGEEGEGTGGEGCRERSCEGKAAQHKEGQDSS